MLDKTKNLKRPLPLWGGIEATVNRVGDRFQDQFEWSGHAKRPCDFYRFAELGIQAIRVPVLWERVAPETTKHRDWSYSDSALPCLQELGMEPIVGLVHHGSGPRYTDLLDPEFPEKLAAYAREVAERYPWVRDYTPVNEPLTTARFSALYGHWYPHAADDLSFAKALLNEVRATVLAMAEIRKVNPNARLVQTDDLGKIHATPELEYQARMENERRWLTWDLLTGRLAPHDVMWRKLVEYGVPVEDLQWHVKNPCPPDVIGVNHYISSERFLDHRLEHHAPDTHGGNGKDRYADVLAARVREEGCDGFQGMLTETWERYGIPIAVTECHMGCTREEQMRWLVEGWRAAHRVREDGADIVGFTVWSLTGAFDWNCLLTQWTGCYEPGVFDLRAPSPRPTALAMVMKSLAKGKVPDHPALDNVGWWERPSRFEHPPVSTGGRAHAAPRTESVREDRPILITGASGTLGRAFARECAVRGLAYRLLSRSDMDISEPASVERAIAEHRPWLVVNTAGYVHVDRAEADSVRCYRENTAGPAVLAGACLKSKARLVTFSSDLLFDGTQSEPYTESDSPNPLGMYGRSKLEAERCVLSAMPEALVVRTSAFFSPHDVHNFVHNVLWTLKSGQAFYATPGQVVSPTYVPDLVSATLDLLIDGESGIWHLANMGEVSWFDFARAAAKAAGLDPYEVRPIQLPEDARRPAYSALASERGWVMPTLESALERYIKALATVPTPASNFAWL